MELTWSELAEKMVQRQLRPRGVTDPKVLRAMVDVPRHRFVSEQHLLRAYGDHALPTAEGQTISQPFVVARMTELLCVRSGDRVLEVGTGSGYQAAILLVLGVDLVTIERSTRLSREAEAKLRELYPDTGPRLRCVVGDGSMGCSDHAPYDRIIVTAASPTLPQALVEQLAEGGRLLIPLGDRDQQVLTCFEHTPHGLQEYRDTPCRFVPLLGKQGFAEK